MLPYSVLLARDGRRAYAILEMRLGCHGRAWPQDGIVEIPKFRLRVKECLERKYSVQIVNSE
jgi:hypothetical protein